MMNVSILSFTILLIIMISFSGKSYAQKSPEELAKELSNPVANLISVPVQSNWDVGIGNWNGSRMVLNIQPVIPYTLSKKLNIISRWILPVISQIDITSESSSQAGLSDAFISTFFSPSKSSITWESMSQLNTALKMGIPATNHTDFNILPIDQMMVVWTPLNRTTRTGVLLGAKERASPYDALKAITINAAHHYFEEDSKRSIKENKLADLVILDQNPLKTDPLKIKEIKVLETIKEGNSIYRKQESTVHGCRFLPGD